MKRVPAKSNSARAVLVQVESLQKRFVEGLKKLGGTVFAAVEWFRDDGRHGGGQRFSVADAPLLGRASINVSQVHYDDEPDRKLGSASAISAIVHPAHPMVPSIHLHISWTERKGGKGYWRIMADLNPSIPRESDKIRISEALQGVTPDLFDEAARQGDQYFYIPALQRHRGVIHFYLEDYSTGNFQADCDLARRVGETAIDSYLSILRDAFGKLREPTDEQTTAQLAYHTLYFFQVLTLDRGTTTGLLVHNQNDVGILGSLPPQIDKNLLISWRSRMPEPQDRLLDNLLLSLPNQGVCVIDDEIKLKLADVVRSHYRTHPEALDLQASGNATPPTIDNHR